MLSSRQVLYGIVEFCAVFCGGGLGRFFSAEVEQQLNAQSIKVSLKRSTLRIDDAKLQAIGSYTIRAANLSGGVPSIRILGRRFFPKIHPYIPCQMLVGYCDVATLRIIQLERFALVLIFPHGGLAQR